MSENKKNAMFLATFIGEYVEMICQANEMETDHPLIVRGYLLDMDDDYYFLGENHLEVKVAMRKTLVSLISIIDDEVDEAKQILENMPIPEKGN